MSVAPEENGYLGSAVHILDIDVNSDFEIEVESKDKSKEHEGENHLLQEVMAYNGNGK